MIVASQWMERRTYLMRLELKAARFYRDEPVVGTARIKSKSAKEVALRRLCASLWSVGSDETPHLAVEARLLDRDTLAPLETRTVPFSLPIPHNLMLGKGRVRLTLSGGLLQYASAPTITVTVAPERRLAALVELAAEIAHHEIDGWGFNPGGAGFNAHLRPKLKLDERIWNIGIDVRPEGEGVSGSIFVMPPYVGFLAAMKSAAQITNRMHAFRLPTTDLEAARPEFERILLRYVNDLHELPIPAKHNESVEHLPVADTSEAVM